MSHTATNGDRKRNRFTLGVCCAAHCIQDGLSAALYVLLPILAQTFGLNYSQIGMIRAVSTGAMTLLELPSGVLAERLGERALIAFGLLAAGVGFMFLSSSTGIVSVTALLLIAGIGSAFQHSLCSSLISRSFAPLGRRSALGTYNAFGDIGKLIFSGAFGLAIGIGLAWQQVVSGFGILTVLSAVVLYWMLKHFQRGARPTGATRTPGTAGRGGWGIRDRWGFTGMSAISFLDSAVQAGFLTFIAFIMTDKQVPAGLASMAIVLTLAGGIFGKYVCGRVAERLGTVRSLIVVQTLTAIGIVAVLLSPTLISYVLLPVLGIVLQGSSTITYGSVTDLVSEARQSRGFGLMYSIANGAGIAGPVAFGVIGDQFGLGPAMMTMALCVMLCVPLCALLRSPIANRV